MFSYKIINKGDMIMALICTEINEWIEEDVSKPIEKWEERTKKKCNKSWYNPFGWQWVCTFVSYFVKVIRWIIVTVGKWVVRTVCKIISAIVTFIIEVFTGLWDVLVGIFTLDWRSVVDGFIQILIAIASVVIKIIRIVFLIDTVAFIIDEITRMRLREYVKGLLEKKYDGELLQQIKDELRIDFGAFGFRIKMSGIRTFVDSETVTKKNPTIPNLIYLHENGKINLRELAGFEFPQGFGRRKRYKTLKKDLVVSGGGGGEFDNPISESELNLYISSQGLKGPKFIILCMRDKALDTKLNVSSELAREIGLMPQWEKKNIEVISPNHIVHDGMDTMNTNALEDFLIDVIGREDSSKSESGAIKDLCIPVTVGIFKYTDTLNGLSSCLKESSCQNEHKASGITYIDNKFDFLFKYVPLHELGHFFGLCHTDGLDRVMFSPKQSNYLEWDTIPNLFLHSGPKFTFEEAKSTWDYIVEHYSANCLAGIQKD